MALLPHPIKATIEALLFVSEKPVSLEQIKEVLAEEARQKPKLFQASGAAFAEITTAEIQEAILELKKEYEDRQSALVIAEIAGGTQMLTAADYSGAVRIFYRTRHKEKLSKPALETLAIVAYKEPATRIEIELIRGVNCDGVMAHLLEKGLIKIVGRRDVPGRPFLYGTTKQFLEYFGLKSLNDLPKLEEFAASKPQGEPISPLVQEQVSTFLKEAQEFTAVESIEKTISPADAELKRDDGMSSHRNFKNEIPIPPPLLRFAKQSGGGNRNFVFEIPM